MQMNAYRIYAMTSRGHFVGLPEVVECADDDAAVESVRERPHADILEIWDRARLVARLQPT
jgi:hypothetical protein